VKDGALSDALRQIRDSHDRRVTIVRDLIRSYGGEPSPTSGVWGAFAKIVQRTADVFGDRAAMSALEEGEDHGVKMYTTDLEGVDGRALDVIREQLLPEQHRTHDLCRSLDRYIKAA